LVGLPVPVVGTPVVVVEDPPVGLLVPVVGTVVEESVVVVDPPLGPADALPDVVTVTVVEVEDGALLVSVVDD
jgi:hypothetical protein